MKAHFDGLMIFLACPIAFGCSNNTEENQLEYGPWGSCGPPQLELASSDVYQEMEEAAIEGLGPGGMFEDSMFGCGEAEASFGVPYLSGVVNESEADQQTDDFLTFGNEYIFLLSCDGAVTSQVRMWYPDDHWEIAGIGGHSGAGMLEELEQSLDSYDPDCKRGLVECHSRGLSFAVVTDEENNTLLYPLNDLDSEQWGDQQGSEIGEIALDKDQFFTWWNS
jgi:hypothetical protein